MACFFSKTIQVEVIGVFGIGCNPHTVSITSNTPSYFYSVLDGCLTPANGDFIEVDITSPPPSCTVSIGGSVQYNYNHYNFGFIDPSSTCGFIILNWDNFGVPDTSKQMIITGAGSPYGNAPPFGELCGGFRTTNWYNTHQRILTGPTNVTLSHSTPLNKFTTTKGIGMRRKPILAAALEAGRECITWAFVGPDIVTAVQTRDCSL